MLTWPSLTITEIKVVPKALAAGAKVIVPVPLGAVYCTSGSSAMAWSLLVAVTVNGWLDLLAGPAVMPPRLTVCVAASSLTINVFKASSVGR